jgi:tetratricopeptide (TPR) repeat protein
LTASRWFPLADLALAATSGLLWMLLPRLGALPLVIALIPWGMRIAAGGFPFRRTRLDPAIAVFLATAGVGVWAAYDPQAAWHKFWLLLAGIFLYYALAAQPAAHFWIVASLVSGVGSLVSVYFLLLHDWGAFPGDFALINRLGEAWMALRPALPLPPIPPNQAGGLLAIFLPFTFSLARYARLERRPRLRWFAWLCAAALSAGLVMSSSRGAWIGLAAGLGGWLSWSLTGVIYRRFQLDRPRLFILFTGLAALATLAVALVFPGRALALFSAIPGANSAGSRLALARDALYLLPDYLWIGGGLDSFGGLYSQYILVIPHFIFGYSHNLFLDIALEQGLFGALAFIAILGGGAWFSIWNFNRAVFRRPPAEWMNAAALASLAVIIVHGLVDDPLYGETGTFLLFMVPGILASLSAAVQPLQEDAPAGYLPAVRQGNLRPLTVAILAIIAVIVIGYLSPIRAGLIANLGAVSMGRIELAGFPTGKWDDGRRASRLSEAQQRFEQALRLDADNLTAHYRLGLIASLRRDFPAAVRYLAVAHQIAPDHRGIRKSYGYALVWSGTLDQAASVLHPIAEASREMNIYVTWWPAHGRRDLADKAAKMASLLVNAETSNPESISTP